MDRVSTRRTSAIYQPPEMTIEEQFSNESESRACWREQIITLCTLSIYESINQVLLARDLYSVSEKEDAERWPQYARDVLNYIWEQNDAEKIQYPYLYQLISLIDDTEKIAELMSLTLSMSALALLPENILEDLSVNDFIEMSECSHYSWALEVFVLHWLVEDRPMPFEAVRTLCDNDFGWEFINMLMLDAQGLHDGNFSFLEKAVAA